MYPGVMEVFIVSLSITV